MPYTYHKDPRERHGTQRHVYLGVDLEADQTRTWPCACGNKKVLTIGLAHVTDVADVEGMSEWLERSEVNNHCAAKARQQLGLAPALTEVDGVTLSKSLYLKEAGIETWWDLVNTSEGELAMVEGIDKELAARIKTDVGGHRESEAVAYNERLTSWGGGR